LLQVVLVDLSPGSIDKLTVVWSLMVPVVHMNINPETYIRLSYFLHSPSIGSQVLDYQYCTRYLVLFWWLLSLK